MKNCELLLKDRHATEQNPEPENAITVILTYRGEAFRVSQPLGEAFLCAEGPQSLESGCMSAVREICQTIETKHRGYRFRSRLEARWAVFFDSIGLKWEYEKEGFDLDGVYYLPDFYLPEWNCWIEIKGKCPINGGYPYGDKKLDRFSKEALLFVFYGLPGENPGYCFCHDTTDSSGGEILWDGLTWCLHNSDNKPRTATNDSRVRSFFYGPNWTPTDFIVQTYDANFWDQCIDDGFLAARQARFEHGENT
jgi:hypothetical protein